MRDTPVYIYIYIYIYITLIVIHTARLITQFTTVIQLLITYNTNTTT